MEDAHAFESAPTPHFRFKSHPIFIGDGGRKEANIPEHSVSNKDCVTRALAFFLADGKKDDGVAYRYAHDLISSYDIKNHDACYEQNLYEYKNAYFECGLKMTEIFARRNYETLLDTYGDNFIIAWTKHAYAVVNGMLYDSFIPIISPTGKMRNKLVHAIFLEDTSNANLRNTRKKLGLTYAKKHGRVCEAYKPYVSNEDLLSAGLTPDYGEIWRKMFELL